MARQGCLPAETLRKLRPRASDAFPGQVSVMRLDLEKARQVRTFALAWSVTTRSRYMRNLAFASSYSEGPRSCTRRHLAQRTNLFIVSPELNKGSAKSGALQIGRMWKG